LGGESATDTVLDLGQDLVRPAVRAGRELIPVGHLKVTILVAPGADRALGAADVDADDKPAAEIPR
jgi:hypothetical protein